MIKTSTMVTGALPPKNVATLSPVLSLLVLAGAVVLLLMFSYHATYVSSMAYSSPSIVIDAGRTSDGTESCTVRRLNTYPDSKILSWWDYGYQMSAMANRTILVDNNTWNNTHITTVGRAHAIFRVSGCGLRVGDVLLVGRHQQVFVASAHRIGRVSQRHAARKRLQHFQR